MSIGCNIDGVNRNVRQFGMIRGGSSYIGMRWYAGIDGVDKMLFDHLDTSTISGLEILWNYAYYRTYSGTTQSSNTLISSMSDIVNFNVYGSGNQIVVTQNGYNCGLIVYPNLRLTFNNGNGPLNLYANNITKSETTTKLRLTGVYQYNALETGGTGTYSIGYSNGETYVSAISGTIQTNSSTSVNLYPLTPRNSSYGDIYIGCSGYDGNARRQAILTINATWDGKSLPVTATLQKI